MAAALALAFQSTHLQDGMAEFLTMVRGCNLIAGDEMSLNEDSVFHVRSTCSNQSCSLILTQARYSAKTITSRQYATALIPRQ